MQISKLLLAVCAVTAGAVALPVQGADTEAQAKAREALRQKMNETAPAAQPAPVAPQAPVAPKAPKAPVVPVAQPAPSAPVLSAAPAADPEAVAKAREAVRQKMLELDRQQQAVIPPPAQPPVVTPPVTEPVPPSVVAQPAPVAPDASSYTAPVLNMPPGASPEAIARAREALRKKMDEIAAQTPPAAPPVTVQPSKPQPQQPSPGVEPMKPQVAAKPDSRDKGVQAFLPLEGPPSPVSLTKQQQLSELLRRYRADELTPEEYHAERSKILAAP